MMAAELSKLLFEARESIEMLADIVEARAATVARHQREVVAKIDAYREEQGWRSGGYGGEHGYVTID